MSILEQAAKPGDGPVIATITGDAGVGKTVLAATFPNPVFIRAEDGLQSIPYERRPDALPKLKNCEDLWDQLTALVKEEHQYQTLVVDSVTQLETMFHDWVLENDPKKPKSINQAMGGYGAGRTAIGAQHGRLRQAAEILKNRRGMNVIFIAHADTNVVELPDQDPYTRYDLRLHSKSMTHYTDNVDLVAYLKLQTFTTGDGERKKALSDGTRVAVCYTTAANISKNRYGITDDLVVPEGENPFIPYIPSLSAGE